MSFLFFPVYCNCIIAYFYLLMSFLFGAMGWSVIYDCGISGLTLLIYYGSLPNGSMMVVLLLSVQYFHCSHWDFMFSPGYVM